MRQRGMRPAHAPALVWGRTHPKGLDACAGPHYDLMNASRSVLMVSAWVVGIPWGKPGSDSGPRP